jgi:chromosome segregation ATPase
MRSALEPFVRELGEVREELGRERERRENAERRVEELERRLEPEREEAQEPAQRRPWWRKIFSG